jgi:sugar phosphate isomerase/epimerase
MEIGIMAKTFARPDLEGVLDAVRAHGFRSIQFHLTCAGLPLLPDRLEPMACDRIHFEMARRGIAMAAVSGTFNMIHPDPEVRRSGLRRLEVLAAACRQLGTRTITLSTGTRDPDDMWRRHPGNDAPEAWQDMLQSIREAARIAARHDVILAFEPEVSNVVDSARKARRLLDEIGSDHLKVVIDAANLFHAGELPRMREIIDEAFELLEKDIVLAHAKDLSRDGEAGHQAAGTGLLDYDHYIDRLAGSGFQGSLILHSLTEEQIEACTKFILKKGRGRFHHQNFQGCGANG